MSDYNYDCIVVGSGHAGSCAALSAIHSGCNRVLIVDKCPKEWVGGNGYFTAGAHRTVHAGLNDLLPIVTNVTTETASNIDMEPYTAYDFTEDIMRLSQGRSDSALVLAVVENSRQTIQWLSQRVGVPFTLSFNRQAYEINGRQRFWGGMVLSVADGGKGLIAAHQKALQEAGVDVWFDSPAIQLIMEDEAISGIIIRRHGEDILLRTSAVVLAAGGFEASKELRIKHLDDMWARAKVRGSPYNTGDGFVLGESVGAKMVGDWQGCHSTCWDANAPNDCGDRVLTNQFTKSGYPIGIMVNCHGRRFVDEGEDFRNYTYAKFGKAILTQPNGFAFQIWDKRVVGHLRKEEYGPGVVQRIEANSPEDLANHLAEHGLVDKPAFLKELAEYNEATLAFHAEHENIHWNPAIKDGLSTQSTKQRLLLPKSNWALPIDRPPFTAVKVGCGITFTFGGLAIDPATAGVLSRRTDRPIPGLFCTGEMVGGLFYDNYPGGSGLTAGAVFGRMAGQAAAEMCNCEVSALRVL